MSYIYIFYPKSGGRYKCKDWRILPTLKKINLKKTIVRHIMSKLQKTKDQKKILKASTEIQRSMKTLRLLETRKAKTQWNNIFTMMKGGKNYQSSFLYPYEWTWTRILSQVRLWNDYSPHWTLIVAMWETWATGTPKQ